LEADFHRGIQFYADQVPCAGRWCVLAHCLNEWVESLDRGETLSQEETQRIKQWYGPVIARQVALLDGQPRRTFDKILLAGTEFREFLNEKRWSPRSGAEVYIERYQQGRNSLRLVLNGKFGPSSCSYPDCVYDFPTVQVSEMLPMALWTGSSVTVIDDPWTAIGLVIGINETNYVVAFRKLLE